MSERYATRLHVGDIVTIGEIGPNQRHLIASTEPPASAVPIRQDSEGRDVIGLPGTLPNGLREFTLVGHWSVEQTIAAAALHGLLGEEFQDAIRRSYEQPPYEIPD